MGRYELPLDEKGRFFMPLDLRKMLQLKHPDNWKTLHMVLIDESDYYSVSVFDDDTWQERDDLFYEEADTLEEQKSIDEILRTGKTVMIGSQYRTRIPGEFLRALKLGERDNIAIYDFSNHLDLLNPKDSPPCYVRTPEDSERLWQEVI